MLTTNASIDDPVFIEAFDALAQNVFNTLVSKRVYEKHGQSGFYSSWRNQNMPNHQAEINALHRAFVENVTTDDIKQVLERKLLSMLKLNEGSEYVALPQFMTSLPSKYYLVNK
jgi:hypothetical protein